MSWNDRTILKLILAALYVVAILPFAVINRLRGKSLPRHKGWQLVEIDSRDRSIYRSQY